MFISEWKSNGARMNGEIALLMTERERVNVPETPDGARDRVSVHPPADRRSVPTPTDRTPGHARAQGDTLNYRNMRSPLCQGNGITFKLKKKS